MILRLSLPVFLLLAACGVEGDPVAPPPKALDAAASDPTLEPTVAE